MAFTLIFEGDIREFKSNPLKADTPFGTAYAAGVGDAFEEINRLEELLEKHGIEKPSFDHEAAKK